MLTSLHTLVGFDSYMIDTYKAIDSYNQLITVEYRASTCKDGEALMSVKSVFLIFLLRQLYDRHLQVSIDTYKCRSKDPCRGALLVVELSFNLWNYILLCFYLHLTIWRNCSPPLTIFPKQSHRLIVCSILV